MSDIRVKRRNAELLEISSQRTRGVCALVIIEPIAPANPRIVPQLIPPYMNGVTLAEMYEAIDDFLDNEDKYRFS